MMFDLKISQRIAMILIVSHQGCLMADRSGLICSITVGTGGEVGWMRGLVPVPRSDAMRWPHKEPDESCGNEDRHKAPALPRHPPPVPTVW